MFFKTVLHVLNRHLFRSECARPCHKGKCFVIDIPFLWLCTYKISHRSLDMRATITGAHAINYRRNREVRISAHQASRCHLRSRCYPCPLINSRFFQATPATDPSFASLSNNAAGGICCPGDSQTSHPSPTNHVSASNSHQVRLASLLRIGDALFPPACAFLAVHTFLALVSPTRCRACRACLGVSRGRC